MSKPFGRARIHVCPLVASLVVTSWGVSFKASTNFTKINQLEIDCSVMMRTYVSNPACGNVGQQGPSGGFLITGVGRSGTDFVHQLMQAAGMDVSHDNADGRGLHGAVSWPHAIRVPGCPVPKWSYNVSRFFDAAYLLIRDPLKTIASRASLDWNNEFDHLMVEDTKCQFELGSMSAQSSENKSLEWALKLFVLQSSFVEKYAQSVIRLEDLSRDPSILVRICERFGGKSAHCLPSYNFAAQFIMGTDTNAHEHTSLNVTWKSLGELNRSFAAMAQRLAQKHGYFIPRQELFPEAAFDYNCSWSAAGRWQCLLGPEAQSLLDDAFSLERLVSSQGAGHYCRPLRQLNKDTVVTLSIPDVGSTEIRKALAEGGQRFVQVHNCALRHLSKAGAGNIIVPLQDPILRVVDGFLSRKKRYRRRPSRLWTGFFNSVPTVNLFIDALRNTSDPKHRLATDMVYRPEAAMFMVPISEFFFGGDAAALTSSQVTLMCACTVREELMRKFSDLKMSAPAHGLRLTDAKTRRAMLSAENQAWIHKIYASDHALFLQKCGVACK